MQLQDFAPSANQTQFGYLYSISNATRSAYSSLQTKFTVKAIHGFTLLAGYTYSHAIAEAYNMLNHPSFGTVDTQFGDETFGQTTQPLNNSLSALSPFYEPGRSRKVQLAVRVKF